MKKFSFKNLLNRGPSKKDLIKVGQQLLAENQRYTEMYNASHSGGNGSTRPGDGSKYYNGLAGSGSSIEYQHRDIRTNARTAMFDSVQLRTEIQRFVDLVIGPGLRMQPTPDYRVLGISAEEAREWSKFTKGRFHLWANSKDSDYTGINNYYQNQRLYNLFDRRDNDQFVRFHYVKDPDLLNPLQIQMLDADQIDGDATTTTSGGNYSLHDGIKRDSRGREVSCRIWYWNNKGEQKFEDVPMVGRSGRRFMIHGYQPEFAGQGRGFSGLVHLLQESQKLTDFILANIDKAAAQSKNIGVIESKEGTGPSTSLFESFTNRGVGGTKATSGNSPSPDPDKITPDTINFTEAPEISQSNPGAALLGGLGEGQTLKWLANTAPVADYKGFTETFTGDMFASRSMPVEVALMKFGQNFSASRGTLALFWQVIQILIMEQTTDFDNYVYRGWLSEEIAAGRITAPGWSDPTLRAAWSSCRWIGNPIPDIDPLKSAKAATERTKNGTQTMDDAARDFNNSTAEENLAQLASEFEKMPELMRNSFFGVKGEAGGGQVAKLEEMVQNILDMIDDINPN